MGWWYKKDYTKQMLIDELIKVNNVLDHSLVGNNLWMLVKSGDARVVCLSLLRSERWYGYGSKDIDETMGPGGVNCPLRLINNATEPLNEYSKGWREDVREYHRKKRTQNKWKKRTQNKWKAGDQVLWWNGDTFTLREKFRQTWYTMDYRKVTTRQLNRSGKLL